MQHNAIQVLNNEINSWTNVIDSSPVVLFDISVLSWNTWKNVKWEEIDHEVLKKKVSLHYDSLRLDQLLQVVK